jgi:hypothetical protein
MCIRDSGYPVSIQEFGPQVNMQLTYLPLSVSSTDAPEIGTPFDFEDRTWNINSVSDATVVDGFEVFTIDATSYSQIH